MIKMISGRSSGLASVEHLPAERISSGMKIQQLKGERRKAKSSTIVFDF